MTPSVIAALAWLLAANVAGILPSRDNHWRRAYWLIALAVPVLVWLFVQNPAWVGLAFLLAAISVLRWPVIYLGRWLRRKTGF